uniref:SAM domain-containing protein n=1 Tax=Romanomermis culicivorax TaxID=13658 RepID=A0A915ITH0_ROMCU
MSPLLKSQVGKAQTQIFRPQQRKEHDAMSLSSTLSSSLSICSDDRDSPKSLKISNTRNFVVAQSVENHNIGTNFIPEVPPPDYDLVDSGNGSDPDDSNANTRNSAHFTEKTLHQWTQADVFDWLDSLRMVEYKSAFGNFGVDGRILNFCDRTEFTKLGVTRVAHRVAMENSLRQYKEDEQL